MFKINFLIPKFLSKLGVKPIYCEPGKQAHGGDNDDVICGQDGDNTLIGGGGGDSIQTGNGCDVVYGNQGDDCVVCEGESTIFGGIGNDTIYVTKGPSVIYGNLGDDQVYVSDDECHQIWGGAGNDTLVGGNGAESLIGGKGNDLIDAMGGDDFVIGGSGSDTISGGAGNDTLFGGTENDTLYGNEGHDLMYGGQNDDYVAGGAGNDTLVGNDGRDVLIGGQGDDRLYGGSGNDLLQGNEGNDTLSGGKNEGCINFTDGVYTPAPIISVKTTCNTFGASSDCVDGPSGWNFEEKGITVTGLDANLCATGTPLVTTNGTTSLGVDGRTVVDAGVHEIGFNPFNGRSEAINFKSEDVISHAKFDLGGFYGPETTGRADYKGLIEKGMWTAYDNANHYVASGTFLADADGKLVVDLAFAIEQNVHSVSLSALEYVKADGSEWDRTDQANADCLFNDSSDFVITGVSICTDVVTAKQAVNLEPVCVGSKIINMTIGDTLVGGAGADTYNSNYDNGVQLFQDFNAAEGDKVRLLGFNASDIKVALQDAVLGHHENVVILGANMALVNGTGNWTAADFMVG